MLFCMDLAILMASGYYRGDEALFSFSNPAHTQSKEQHMDSQRTRMLNGALNYAKADRSDPFAYSRAMSHINSGVASIGPNGEDSFYDAEPFADPSKFHTTAYKNIRRP